MKETIALQIDKTIVPDKAVRYLRDERPKDDTCLCILIDLHYSSVRSLYSSHVIFYHWDP